MWLWVWVWLTFDHLGETLAEVEDTSLHHKVPLQLGKCKAEHSDTTKFMEFLTGIIQNMPQGCSINYIIMISLLHAARSKGYMPQGNYIIMYIIMMWLICPGAVQLRS